MDATLGLCPTSEKPLLPPHGRVVSLPSIAYLSLDYKQTSKDCRLALRTDSLISARSYRDWRLPKNTRSEKEL